MLAIPSPDLLLNLFASGAQALGLLGVAVGGAWVSRKRLGGTEQRRAGSPWPFRIAALLLVGVSVSFFLYVLDTHDARNRRLQANLLRSSTEGGKKVGDTSLKTLAFSDQDEHPRAVDTEVVAAWLAEGRPLNIIDVREPEEIEMGRIAGSWARRYPDLRVNREGLIKPGMETILLCDSGNRSSELSDVFAAEGIECKFIIGGCSKWVAENRRLVDGPERTAIRDLPDFPNKDVLLDTDEVQRLVQEENAVFVDVRYPEEFARGALPGAILVTLRKLKLEELEPTLSALPRRPIVAPCYDKRSSFYAMLLGLRLHRLGYDFRGRYSVPHEYVVPSPELAYLAAWNADRAERTMFTVAAGAVATRLDEGGRSLGGLLWAVLVAVVLARVLLLPLTLKADRDQLALRGLAGELAGIRAANAKDPARARRLVAARYRAAGLTPVRNLLGSLLQLVVFLVLFAAVDQAAAGHGTPFLWLDGLGVADPLRVLPVAVGVAFLGLLLLTAAKCTLRRVVLGVAFGGLVAAALWTMSAAVSIYLLLNVVLMAGQRLVLERWWRRKHAPAVVAASVPTDAPVPLARAEGVAAAGRKAQRLARLIRAGFPVPSGFVVCGPIPLQAEANRRAILRAFARLRTPLVAVRSSGMAEDGANSSHAGEFDSILQVPRDRVLGAVERVQASLRQPNSRDERRCDEGGVLVQAMVPAEHAGVLFTEDPACAGAMLVEMTEGLGDGLVSGRVDPDAYRFGRLTLRPLQEEPAAIDLQPLLELGRAAERLFGRPQDIEWAYADGRFHILQSRDITCSVEHATHAEAMREAERARLLELARGERAPEAAVLAQTELTELLPEPTPMSLALMNELWGKDGSVELAAERLGIPYQVGDDSSPYAVAVFGRLYVNRSEERRRFARSIGTLASLRLTRGAAALEADFRERFLPVFRRDVRLREAVDLTQLSLAELVEVFGAGRTRFVREVYVEAEVVNLASTFFADVARRRLRRAGIDPAEVLGVGQATVLPRVIAKLRLCGDDEVAASLAEFAHRAPHDFELAQPRYGEAPDEMRRLVAAARAGTDQVRAAAAATRLGRLDRIAVSTADRFESLKEEAKHEVLRELACLRAVLLEIGRRLDLGDGVFWLLPDEVASCAQAAKEDLRARVSRRRAEREAQLGIELPAELTFADLETLGSPFTVARVATESADDVLRGLRVAGAGDVVGRARVLRDPGALDGFDDGDVLVARFTDPRWLPLFRRARGIVTEVGGWLSHAAIQAREHRLPAIVGVRGVMASLRDGDIVRLCTDGSIETIAERRGGHRLATRQPAVVHLRGAAHEVQILDASAGGLRLAGSGVALEVGDVLRIESGRSAASATVVRADSRGAGVLLHEPLSLPVAPARQVPLRVAAG